MQRAKAHGNLLTVGFSSEELNFIKGSKAPFSSRKTALLSRSD
ncbi:hypothetical protein [Alteromonas sp. BMJM2]|nr:hypothetical protein [Alteromonas sp. BMJM2]